MISSIKMLIFFILLCQDVTDESGNQFVNQQQRQFYRQKIYHFRRENEKVIPGGVVFIGNSIVEAFELHKYFPGVNAHNRGITGDRIGLGNDGGILKRMKESCYDLMPSKVFLLVGINDIGDRRRTIQELSKGYRDIIYNILDTFPDIEIYVHSILPTAGVFTRLNPAIDSLNNILIYVVDSLYTQHTNITYIDLHSVFADEEGDMRREYTIEGLHLKNIAYQLWADCIFNYVYSGQCFPLQINLNDSTLISKNEENIIIQAEDSISN